MVDAIGQIVGDLASAITDAIARFIVRTLHLSPSPILNTAIKIALYILLFVPIALAVIWALLHLLSYAVVCLFNLWMGSAAP